MNSPRAFHRPTMITVLLMLSAGVPAPALAAPPVEGLAAFKATLAPVTQTYVDLRQYQTPVRNQGWSPSCYTFALVGAIEAAYKRRCALHPLLANTEPYCARQLGEGVDLDLSEWQLYSSMATQTPTRNPQASHESLTAICAFNGYLGEPAATWASHDAVLVAARGIRIAEEIDSPFPDWDHAQAFIAEGMGQDPKAYQDYGAAFCSPDPPLPNMNFRYDAYGYDPLNVSYDAQYGAVYGVTRVQVIPWDDVRRWVNLEQYLANNYEVDMGINLRHLDCSSHPEDNGAAQCYPSTTGGFGDKPHALLAVGYDHVKRRFLFKNSWGDSLPYLWIPYSFVRQATSASAYIVRGVRAARVDGATHEQAFLGTWVVFDSKANYRGKLAIHRTREMPHQLPGYVRSALTAPSVTEDLGLRRRARLGTFITTASSPRKVYGELTSAGSLRLFVGKTATGPGGDRLGTRYSGGTGWGLMSLTSADTAVDTLGKSYVRDFSARAKANWSGKWDLMLHGSQSLSQSLFTISNYGTVPSPEGRFPFKGTYKDSIEIAVEGYVDQRGEHTLFEFDHPGIGNGGAHCVLDLTHERTVLYRQIMDGVLAGVSTLSCGGAEPLQVTGYKR